VRVVIDYRSALKTPSGVGEYCRGVVRGLLALPPAGDSRNALDVTVFSSSWKDRLDHRDDLAGARVVDRRVPVSVLNFAWHRLEWPPAELLAAGSFDIAHSLHPLLLPARRAARVVTIHDLNFLSHPERTRAEIRRDYPALVRPHAHRADQIIVPSKFVAREVERQLAVPSGRISVCPAGAPRWTARPSQPARGYILFFGTLEPRKNVGTLLDAYERLLASLERTARAISIVPQLLLAGQSLPDSQNWLDRISRAPLAGHARHIGYVDAGDRQRLYEGAALLVQPSFEEGFGMTVLEAMTAGVPVVASNRGSLPEVLGDAGVLVEPEDSAAMAAAIERMLSDEVFATACATKGVARARGFTWSGTAERVFAAYHLALEHRGQGRTVTS
jgi:glycosyltransferase involved in cell wall biosynthesis